MSGKRGDGCLGDGYPLQVEVFLYLAGDPEASHYLVHVLGLAEDKGWDQDKWSPRKSPANAGNPKESTLIDLH